MVIHDNIHHFVFCREQSIVGLLICIFFINIDLVKLQCISGTFILKLSSYNIAVNNDFILLSTGATSCRTHIFHMMLYRRLYT